MYFVAFVTDKPGMEQKHRDLQGAFTGYLRDHPDHPDVVVHHAGPTHDVDTHSIAGLLLIVEAPSVAEARAFVAGSPFGQADIFAETQIRRWDWRTGSPD